MSVEPARDAGVGTSHGGLTMNTTPVHSVRIPEELWERASRKAAREGVQMSTVIRRYLFAYVRDDKR